MARLLPCLLLLALAACGPTPGAGAPAPDPAVRASALAQGATTVEQWQTASEAERHAAATKVIGFLFETTRLDQRERMADEVNDCLDRKIVALKPTDGVYTAPGANFHTCLFELGYR